jgi:hypothetical protein
MRKLLLSKKKKIVAVLNRLRRNAESVGMMRAFLIIPTLSSLSTFSQAALACENVQLEKVRQAD